VAFLEEKATWLHGFCKLQNRKCVALKAGGDFSEEISLLGWQANVIWRITIFIRVPFGANVARMNELITGFLIHISFY
jgi:hypothetical protein